MTTKDKWLWCYLPTGILWSLPAVALGYLFGEGLNPDKALFSNDGPIGVSYSHWMQSGYKPGGAMWVDTSWLGFSGGRNPVALSQIIYWLCLHPSVMIPVVVTGTTACLYLIVKDILNSPKELEKAVAPYRPAPYTPKNTSKQCWFFRYLLFAVIFRFAWVALGKDVTIHSVEAFCWLAYGFLGLPAWLSAEVENYEYEKNTVR